jgi:hypothetical protein
MIKGQDQKEQEMRHFAERGLFYCPIARTECQEGRNTDRYGSLPCVLYDLDAKQCLLKVLVAGLIKGGA